MLYYLLRLRKRTIFDVDNCAYVPPKILLLSYLDRDASSSKMLTLEEHELPRLEQFTLFFRFISKQVFHFIEKASG